MAHYRNMYGGEVAHSIEPGGTIECIGPGQRSPAKAQVILVWAGLSVIPAGHADQCRATSR